jgi:hypothetical protein
MSTTPKTSVLTKLYYADAKVTGTRSQVIYVQEIPALKEVAEAVAYNALDFASERQEKGPKMASSVTIPILYEESQHTTLKALADAGTVKHWFVRYPDVTAASTGKPLVKYFTASIDLEGDTISIGEMLQDNMTLYINSDVTETLDFPSA